jgi:uncharacterized protein
VLASLLLGSCLLLAQDAVPKNDGWVTDLAGLLTQQQEQGLETLMESYRAGTTHEIAVLTVPDLGGQTIERFALEVGRAWKIGGAEKNNGALLVVAKAERKLRIEVGRGLEGDLPDALAWRIIDKVITPELKQGRPFEGIHAGITAMHAAIGGDYGPIQSAEDRSPEKLRVGLFVLLWFVVFLIAGLRRRGGGGRGGRRLRGGFWPIIPIGGFSGGGVSGGGFSGGGFGGFGGGGGFSGGGASGGW